MLAKLVFSILTVLSLSGFWAHSALAQKATNVASKKDADENLNKKDGKNRKQGMWFFERNAQYGEPGFYEFGNYLNDKRSGLWYKMSQNKDLMSIEHFKFDVLDGPAQYFESGKLVATGTYRGIFTSYKYDSFMVRNPETDLDTLIVLPAEIGHTKHGLWRFYDSKTGQLILEQEYQVDFLLNERRFEAVESIKNKNISTPKLPHEGGKIRGWSTGRGKSKNSLTK